jgi:hypothetical protein
VKRLSSAGRSEASNADVHSILSTTGGIKLSLRAFLTSLSENNVQSLGTRKYASTPEDFR